MGEHYILSLKWSKDDYLTWWGPNDCGYTHWLDKAGRYTRAVAAMFGVHETTISQIKRGTSWRHVQ